MKFEGIYTPVVTPHTDSFEIDRLLFEQTINMLIDSGVSVGTGAIRTEDSIYFAQQAKALGADALLVATPPYAYPTGREIALHALAIDREATDCTCWRVTTRTYNCPAVWMIRRWNFLPGEHVRGFAPGPTSHRRLILLYTKPALLKEISTKGDE